MKGLTREEYVILKRLAEPTFYDITEESKEIHRQLIEQGRSRTELAEDRLLYLATRQGVEALRIYEELLKIGVVLT